MYVKLWMETRIMHDGCFVVVQGRLGPWTSWNKRTKYVLFTQLFMDSGDSLSFPVNLFLVCFIQKITAATALWSSRLQVRHFSIQPWSRYLWLSGVVVSALGIRARCPGFESRVAPLCHWVTTLGKLFTHIASAVSQLQETAVQKGFFGA